MLIDINKTIKQSWVERKKKEKEEKEHLLHLALPVALFGSSPLYRSPSERGPLTHLQVWSDRFISLVELFHLSSPCCCCCWYFSPMPSAVSNDWNTYDCSRTFKIIHQVPGMAFSGGRRQGSVPPGLISKPSQWSSQSARGQNMSRNNVFWAPAEAVLRLLGSSASNACLFVRKLQM